MKPATFNRQLATVQEVKATHEADLLPLENVVGVGVGYKIRAGKPTGELALIVYVEKKRSKRSLSKANTVPASLTVAARTSVVPQLLTDEERIKTLPVASVPVEVPTDVKEVGRIEAQTFQDRLRPVKPGFSLGHFSITAGTFGCLVRDLTPPHAIYLLSNNHVLANSNAANIGDPILQPGPFDGGQDPEDIVAKLERFMPIRFGSPEAYNLVDAALALPTDSYGVIASIVGLGIPKGTEEATLGMQVTKSGRTTQTTTGEVIDIDATIAVNYGTGSAYFRNQIITTDMSEGGDSGSLVLAQETNKAVGLLFAGSSEVTIHNHLSNVLMALGVELVTA